MASESKASAPAPACPDRDTLANFCRGRLADESLDVIAEHISLCPRCATLLEEMQSSETILSHLRRPAADKPFVDEAICQRVAEKARAIGEAEAVASTVSDASPADAEPGPPLPAVFGPYLLLQRLGQGGMGVVYKARQETLKRLVAVKMIRAGMYASNEERQRFRREGEAIARIRHAHVVQIYEFGEHEGQPFFSMELLEGGTLSGRLRDGALPQREAAELVRTLALAVAAAHEQGIVHRDLKPGNVLFAADGTAKVTDFGLAKILDGADSATVSDAILGTPVYMSPEQARGESRQIGPATDVYALGAILYETLTGHPPFGGGSRSRTLAQVREEEPEPPSRRGRGLSRDLEAICLKCLEKDPGRRYPSATALADDLDRWLKGEPMSIRPSSRIGRLVRRSFRYPLIRAAVCLVALVAAVVPVALYLLNPDRLVHKMEQRLRQGEEVTLIGDTGTPVWSRWTARPGIVLPPSKEGAFTISAHESSLLTLLSDPQRSYRFSALVQHTDSSPVGEVGIHFVHSRHIYPQGTHHCYCTLAFNDREVNYTDPQTKWRSSRVNLSMWRWEPSIISKTNLAGVYFLPAATMDSGSTPWRALAVEVRPERLEVFWEGQSFAIVPVQTMLSKFDSLNHRMAGGLNVEICPGLQPTFTPRDSLGLYVVRGTASYRQVVVQPLP